MKKLFFMLMVAGCLTSSSGQNLVENCSFEASNTCPMNYTERKLGSIIDSWSSPTYGTPDYFNSCSRINVGVPSNMMGNRFAIDGQAYAGLILLQEPLRSNQKQKGLNYREYLQTELIEPLMSDSLYAISFWYSPADHSTYTISTIGLILTPDPVSRRKGILEFDPVVESPGEAIAHTPGTWYQLQDTIKAVGKERYLTIGNFRDDKSTSYTNIDCDGHPVYLKHIIIENSLAYYYIDQVEVSAVNGNVKLNQQLTSRTGLSPLAEIR